MATWSIVVTANEPLVNIMRFVAYHLDMGVDRIFIFLDNADDLATEHLLRIEKVQLYVCDDKYWQESSLGERPEKHQYRQKYNANLAYKLCLSDWIIHIDVDELLADSTGEETISAILNRAQTNVLRILPMEPLWSEDNEKSTLFHGGYYESPKNHSKRLFGVQMHKTLLLEHYYGKSFVRTGLKDTRLEIHRCSTLHGTHEIEISSTINLLHCVNFGPVRWAAKYKRRIGKGTLYPFGYKFGPQGRNSPQIAGFRNIELAYAAGGVSDVASLFVQCKHLQPTEFLEMYKLVRMYELEFDFGASVHKYFMLADHNIEIPKGLIDWEIPTENT